MSDVTRILNAIEGGEPLIERLSREPSLQLQTEDPVMPGVDYID